MNSADRVNELKDKVLSLIVSDPSACLKAVRRLQRYQVGIRKLAFTFHFIGFEYSRQIFDSLTEAQWEHLERVFYSESNIASQESEEEILLFVYTELLGEVMIQSNTPVRHQDPFQFLKKLSPEKLKEIFHLD